MEETTPTGSDPGFQISSKKKWIWAGFLIALLNPVFAGLIIGAVYLGEPELKRAGQAIAAVSVVWGAILFYLMQHSQFFIQ